MQLDKCLTLSPTGSPSPTSPPGPRKIIIKGTETPKLIPDASICGCIGQKGCGCDDTKRGGSPEPEPGPPAPVPLPVDTEEEDCTVDNVAIAIAIEHERVDDLLMKLKSPNGDEVPLRRPSIFGGQAAGSSKDNLIIFDDSFSGALDPQELIVDADDNIIAGTYFARGKDPNPEGLGKFNGMEAEGTWTFEVIDFKDRKVGFIYSVEMEITCEEPKPSEHPSSSPAPSESSVPTTLLRPTVS